MEYYNTHIDTRVSYRLSWAIFYWNGVIRLTYIVWNTRVPNILLDKRIGQYSTVEDNRESIKSRYWSLILQGVDVRKEYKQPSIKSFERTNRSSMGVGASLLPLSLWQEVSAPAYSFAICVLSSKSPYHFNCCTLCIDHERLERKLTVDRGTRHKVQWWTVRCV